MPTTAPETSDTGTPGNVTTTPEAVDLAAARLHDTAAWQEIVRHWTPAPALPPAPGLPAPH
ncbi:hypothetical protein EAO71_23030, partial [Streptomyces sp. ms191]